MKLKINNKKKFLVRIIELVIIIATIILTIVFINYATRLRGHKAYGGEYCIPILGCIAIMIIEEIYQESENKKKGEK